MILINPEGEFPRYRGNLKVAVPSWNEGDPLPEGWVEVQETTPPTPSKDEWVEQIYPIEENGVWFQAWQIRPMTAEEIERRDAPQNARQKLIDLGLTEIEIQALVSGLVR